MAATTLLWLLIQRRAKHMITKFIRKIFGRFVSYKAEITELRTISLTSEDRSFRDSEFSKKLEAMIDQTLADSFPASDPPAWTLGRERRILNVLEERNFV